MLRRVFAIIAYLIGIGGAGLFMLYVLGTGNGYDPREILPNHGPVPWLNNLFWLLLFAAQHSGMARQSYKSLIVSLIPASVERSTYVLMSGIVLALLSSLWQPLPGDPIWTGPVWIVAISVLATLAVGAFSVWFDHAAFFGLTDAAETLGPLRIEGPYRYVRHPLMLALLIAIWAQPIMPRELFMLNGGMTIYILVAIRLEERDLIRAFGPEYETYRANVPALIPFINHLFPV